MIARISGRLEWLQGQAAVLDCAAAPPDSSGPSAPGGGIPAPGLLYEVLVPAYVAGRLAGRVGQRVTLTTLHYLEAQGQGSAFVPRLIGFPEAADREFFELFTTVKGIGNRKALRALAAEPRAIAAMIASRDAKALRALPEIGTRLAETIVAELHGKVERFLAPSNAGAPASNAEPKLAAGAEEAVAALVALGQTRAEAERLVGRCAARLGPGATPDELLAAVFDARADARAA